MFRKNLTSSKKKTRKKASTFHVEEILASQRRGRRVEYLVKWEEHGHEHKTWEAVAHFGECPELLQQFRQRTGLPSSR